MDATRASTYIVIPSLNPDEKLLKLLSSLKENGFSHIILVNDGSDDSYDSYFETAEQEYGCIVLRHYVNQGKGRALKTAFNYYLGHCKDAIGVVTVDADGQHRSEDIGRCMDALLNEPDKLIMGCRDFSKKDIPFRSKFGNVLTKHVFSMLCGVKVSDTQTGLRAFSTELVRRFMKTKGERFEYEMNMLIDCKEERLGIREIPIETVYIEDNASSHFNPLLDSIRIYSVFMKFILSSLSSFLVDIIFYVIFITLLKDWMPGWYIFVSTCAARIISSVVNYLINRNTVFRNKENSRSSFVKYYILAACQMICSGVLVDFLFGITHLLNETVLKIIVDTILFLLSFRVQQEWVFKHKNRSGEQKQVRDTK